MQLLKTNKNRIMSQDFVKILNDIRNYKKQYINYKSFENYRNYLNEK